MNIISQNFRNVLKTRLESKIRCITSSFVDLLIENLLCPKNSYLTLVNDVHCVSNDLAKQIILEVIHEFDTHYRESKERKLHYYVNKKNVPRTIITIFGELTFYRTLYQSKNKKQYYFYIDGLLALPKYDHYDPFIKGLAIRETFYTNQAQAGRIVGERICQLANLASNNTSPYSISRQAVNNWLKDWNTSIVYEKHQSTPKTLYIMADEKYIGAQGKNENIMAKAFVIFEGVKSISKNRRALINRHIFTCRSSKPWEELLDRLCTLYNYNEIENFYVLSDGGNWLTSGMNELKLESFQKVKHLLCMFHYKQAINHVTTVDSERKEIFSSFLNDKKTIYKNLLNTFTIKYPHRKDVIEKKVKYLLNHYKAAQHMTVSSIGSSMEAHISHFVASTFASRPKGYKEENINKYFILNDATINGINLLNTYLQTYNDEKPRQLCKEAICSKSLLKGQEEIRVTNLPILQYSKLNPRTAVLSSLSKIDNEIRCF